VRHDELVPHEEAAAGVTGRRVKHEWPARLVFSTRRASSIASTRPASAFAANGIWQRRGRTLVGRYGLRVPAITTSRNRSSGRAVASPKLFALLGQELAEIVVDVCCL